MPRTVTPRLRARVLTSTSLCTPSPCKIFSSCSNLIKFHTQLRRPRGTHLSQRDGVKICPKRSGRRSKLTRVPSSEPRASQLSIRRQPRICAIYVHRTQKSLSTRRHRPTMRAFGNIALLAALPAVLGQFGPATTTSSTSRASSASPRASTSIAGTPTSASGVPAPPTESVGCSLHGDHYHCEGPAAGYEPTSVSSGVLAPPTESVGCSLHGDHYHCEGPAPGYTPTATGAQPSAPSPTESPYCMARECSPSSLCHAHNRRGPLGLF